MIPESSLPSQLRCIHFTRKWIRCGVVFVKRQFASKYRVNLKLHLSRKQCFAPILIFVVYTHFRVKQLIKGETSQIMFLYQIRVRTFFCRSRSSYRDILMAFTHRILVIPRDTEQSNETYVEGDETHNRSPGVGQMYALVYIHFDFCPTFPPCLDPETSMFVLTHNKSSP